MRLYSILTKILILLHDNIS